MTISWSALGKETPLVRGIPSQFDEVASIFGRVESQTRCLSEDLHEIRLGESEGFAGEAADSFRGAIGEIFIALTDVPIIAKTISNIFRNHSNSLENIKREARSALARAQTHWNDKERAEQEIDSCRHRLRSIDEQLSALASSCDPSADDARDYLYTRRTAVSGQLNHARRDFASAKGRLEDSRGDWDRIRRDEDDLNEHTKLRLGGVELWSLTDRGNFFTEAASNIFEGIAGALEVIWNYISEKVLEQLFHFLDKLLDWLDVIGFVLEFIPVVGQIYKVVEATVVGLKALTGLALVLQGKMDLSQFLWSTAIDFAGVIPGVPRFLVKGVVKTATKATGIIVKVTSKGADRALKFTGDVIDAGADIAGTVTRKTLELSATITKTFTDVTGWVLRKVDVPWERKFRNLGDTLADGLRKGGKISGDVIGDAGGFVEEGLDKLGDVIDDIGRDIGDFMIDNADDLVDLVHDDQWDMAVQKGLEYGRDHTLGDSGEPARSGQYPILEPCKFISERPVAA